MINSKKVCILATVILVAATFLLGCSSKPKTVLSKNIKKEEQKPLPAVKAEARKVVVTWSERGKTSLSATATEVSGDTVSGSAKMKQVTAELYNKGELLGKLAAPIVEADASNRIISASGGVTLTSEQPNSTVRVVKAGWIKWFARQNRVLGGGGVEAVGPMTTVKAEAFVADTGLRKIKLVADPKQSEAVFGY
jgi:hypothetical protein